MGGDIVETLVKVRSTVPFGSSQHTIKHNYSGVARILLKITILTTPFRRSQDTFDICLSLIVSINLLTNQLSMILLSELVC